MNKLLKPCPFCGQKVEIETTNYNFGSRYHITYAKITCKKCSFSFPNTTFQIRVDWDEAEGQYVENNSDMFNAIAKWNRRMVK